MPNRLNERIDHYLTSRSLSAKSCLGAGTQGTVLACSILSQDDADYGQVAVKFHDRQVAYERELRVYFRLRDLEIAEVAGHMVPQLVHFDDDLLAIEMTIVSPPFCLDFGGAYLDQPPDYSPEVWRDWREQKSEDFGEDWEAVEEILGEFKSFGIFIADVNPGNIRFRNG